MSDFRNTDPADSGLLDVGDGNRVYWESWGDPAGKPVLSVHGGPGAGASTRQPRVFDLRRYRLIRLDQRGCGRSTPHAADPAVDMSVNTTWHLIADIEILREYLGIESWLLYGGSWGATLALAYAQAHPQRVSEIVLVSVTTTRRSEIDWLYRGVGRFFPREWERFTAGVPEVAVNGDITPVLTAYCARMADSDPAIRDAAAEAWVSWEDAVISAESNGTPGAYSARKGAARNAFVRICAHYFSNGAWLEEGQLIRDAERLAGIPGALIHGRLDLGGPLVTPWELAKAWPDATLTIVENSGHTGSDSMRRRVAEALAGFACNR
jgi:proline iminopeptidase